MASAAEWRIAFAKQARADLIAREVLLSDRRVPECQHLHFLQMACEKLCKAHLCGQGADPAVLRGSHAYVARPLPLIAREYLTRQGDAGRRWAVEAIRVLSRRIELLAPAVDAAGSVPANCEYPWQGPDGSVRIPAEHRFNIDLLTERAGRILIKVLHSAVEQLMVAPSV